MRLTQLFLWIMAMCLAALCSGDIISTAGDNGSLVASTVPEQTDVPANGAPHRRFTASAHIIEHSGSTIVDRNEEVLEYAPTVSVTTVVTNTVIDVRTVSLPAVTTISVSRETQEAVTETVTQYYTEVVTIRAAPTSMTQPPRTVTSASTTNIPLLKRIFGDSPSKLGTVTQETARVRPTVTPKTPINDQTHTGTRTPSRGICAAYCSTHDKYLAARFDVGQCDCESVPAAHDPAKLDAYTAQRTADINDGMPEFTTNPRTLYQIASLDAPAAVRFYFDTIIGMVALFFGMPIALIIAVVATSVDFFTGAAGFGATFVSLAVRGNMVLGFAALFGDATQISSVMTVLAATLFVASLQGGWTFLLPLAVAGLLYTYVARGTWSTKNLSPTVLVMCALIIVRFLQAISAVADREINYAERSWMNVLLIAIRIASLGGEGGFFLLPQVAKDSMHLLSTMPAQGLESLGAFSDPELADYAMQVIIFAVRVMLLFVIRWLLSPYNLKKKYRNSEDPLVYVSYVSTIIANLPLRRSDSNENIAVSISNLILTLTTFGSCFEVFAFAAGISFAANMYFGGSVADLPIPKVEAAKIEEKKKKEIKEIVARHVNADPTPIVERPDDVDKFHLDGEIIDRHALFAERCGTLSPEFHKALNKTITHARAPMGKITLTWVTERKALAPLHAFVSLEDTKGDPPRICDDYAVTVAGKKHIPIIVERGTVAADGEAIMRLTFATPVVQSATWPETGHLDLRIGAGHLMSIRGTLSFCTNIDEVSGHPQYVAYEHDCEKADSGAGGYVIDGTVKLVTIHIGAVKKRAIGMLIHGGSPWVVVAQISARDTPEKSNNGGDLIERHALLTEPSVNDTDANISADHVDDHADGFKTVTATGNPPPDAKPQINKRHGSHVTAAQPTPLQISAMRAFGTHLNKMLTASATIMQDGPVYFRSSLDARKKPVEAAKKTASG